MSDALTQAADPRMFRLEVEKEESKAIAERVVLRDSDVAQRFFSSLDYHHNHT
jgi:hypothetical protein